MYDTRIILFWTLNLLEALILNSIEFFIEHNLSGTSRIPLTY